MSAARDQAHQGGINAAKTPPPLLFRKGLQLETAAYSDNKNPSVGGNPFGR